MRNRILIDVPTTAIERVLEKRSMLSKLLFVGNQLFQHPMVKQGNWHRRTIPFTRHPVHLLLQTLLADDACEADHMNALTAYYLARGKSTQQAQQKVGKRLDHYVTRYRKIAESMRRDGYVAALGRDEINVAIAPDGTFIKVSGGNHRLSIAKLIGLPTVVAEIRFVHRDWLRAQPCSRAEPVPERIVAGLETYHPRIVPVGPAVRSTSRGRSDFDHGS